MKQICIAGIHTGIGKTIASAVIAEALGYDYWKPVQAGEPDNTDSMNVSKLISNRNTRIHPEAYKLQLAASPHYAAKEEGLEIDLNSITIPAGENGLIIETAGGIMSPLNSVYTNLDLIKKLSVPVILVVSDYLGSINHTMLSVEILRMHSINTLGIVYSGNEFTPGREFIQQNSGLKTLFSISELNTINPETIAAEADKFRNTVKESIPELC
jgi:dethiobiotin synthetase